MNIFYKTLLAILISIMFVGKVLAAPVGGPPKFHTQSFDVNFTSRTIIDHPVEKVWPHLLDFSSWMTDFEAKPIIGGRILHREGEVLKVTNTAAVKAKLETPYHFSKTLKIRPLEQVGIKVFTAEGGSYGGANYQGVDTLSVVDLGGKTLVIFNVYAEFQLPPMTEEERQVRDEQGTAGMEEKILRYWGNLNSLVDGKAL